MDERGTSGMSDEACALALRNTLSEMKNVCPDITNSFIFKENGEIVAEDQNSTPVKINSAQDVLRALTEKAEVIGGIESITFKGEKARANINRFQDLYVANVASNEADERTIASITRVMIPTVLRLVHGILPSQNRPEETLRRMEPEKVSSPELFQPKPQALKLTVENFGFGSLLKDSSLTLIDTALIAQWNEVFGERKVCKVSIENPVMGKSLITNYEAFKESKYEGKNIVQLSEKTRLALNVTRGAQILLKPIIGQAEETPLSLDDSQQQAKEPSRPTPEPTLARTEWKSFDTPTEQFIVENPTGIGGFLGYNEYARIDNGVIARWMEISGEERFEQVIIEEIESGRKLTCRFKPMKGADQEGKGIIQLPEKIQQALQTKKGALVVVKPVVEA